MNSSLEKVCPIHDECQVVLVVTDILWFPRLDTFVCNFKILIGWIFFLMQSPRLSVRHNLAEM